MLSLSCCCFIGEASICQVWVSDIDGNSDIWHMPSQVISFDVKPANVLLDRTGKHAKLADVGLAKVLEHSHTMTNLVSTY